MIGVSIGLVTMGAMGRLLCNRWGWIACASRMGSRARGTDFRKGKSLGPRDHLITYSKPAVKPDWLSQSDYDAAPDTLCVREMRFSLRKGVPGKTLVTTLCCPKSYKRAALKALYKERWHVELNFRHIKTTLGMDVLSCRTPEMIGKEIWVYSRRLQPDSHTHGPGCDTG